MRILHTSDWHIGRHFEREPLIADQDAFLAWLAELVRERRVDLVIVAGDIYDRSQPSEEAVALLDRGLDALRGAGAQLLLISGNHDSARRLGFGATRQAMGGVHVFADDQHPPVPWVFRADDEQVAIVAVPFLDPYGVPTPRPAADGSVRTRTHQHVLADALAAGRGAVQELDSAGRMPVLAVAHAFVAGSQISESERVLSVGGSELVEAGLFDGFDYVALGHLHRPQEIGGSATVAYSGSPLPYSFSETGEKSVRLVELDGRQVVGVETVPIPLGRPVVPLVGTLEYLLTEPSLDEHRRSWVMASLTDDTVQTQPMDRLRARFPHAVRLRYADVRTGMAAADEALSSVEERDPAEVIADFLEDLRDRPPNGGERELLGSALLRAHGGSDS